MRLHGPSGQRFLADSLRSSGIVNTALGSDNVRWLTHIIWIESQKNGSYFPHEPLPSVKNNLQDIIAYMQVNSPNYKQDIANLKKNIRDYCLFKLLGNHSEKQKIKSQIFEWYQDFLTRVRAIKLNKGL